MNKICIICYCVLKNGWNFDGVFDVAVYVDEKSI